MMIWTFDYKVTLAAGETLLKAFETSFVSQTQLAIFISYLQHSHLFVILLRKSYMKGNFYLCRQHLLKFYDCICCTFERLGIHQLCQQLNFSSLSLSFDRASKYTCSTASIAFQLISPLPNIPASKQSRGTLFLILIGYT